MPQPKAEAGQEAQPQLIGGVLRLTDLPFSAQLLRIAHTACPCTIFLSVILLHPHFC